MIRNALTLQEMINSAVAMGKPLSLPAGVFPISETLDLSQIAGLRIFGAGYYDPENTGPGWSDIRAAIGTKLVWTGAKDGRMFDLHGSLGISFANLVIDGNGLANGIAGWDEPEGWSFSRLKMQCCRVQNCLVGVRFGNTPTAFNSDLSIFHDVIFKNCGVGIEVTNCQSVGHVWENITNENCTDACISVVQGGQITLRNINQDGQNQKTFLRLGAGGSNVAPISIDGGHLESGTLLDATASGQWSNWKVRIRSVLATLPGAAGSGYTSDPLIAASPWPSIDCQDCDFNGRTVQAQPNIIVR